MDDVRGRLLAELLRLRTRAEEIGRQLKDLDRQDRIARLRVLPGGASGPSSFPGVSVANTPHLLAIPGGRVRSLHIALPPPPGVPLDVDGALHVGLEIDRFPKNTV